MSFDSLSYAIFLPVVCLLNRFVPARFRWGVLLGASYVFYAGWNAALSLLILGVTVCSYLSGLLLERLSRKPYRRALLIVTLGMLLGLLVYFKYFNLLGQTAATLMGLSWQVRDILLPVGISFYTFQAISYVVDVYRHTIHAERHFGLYALYIAFFPQLVAGPIERAGALLPQFRAPRPVTRADLNAGCRLLLSGFFRKLVVADLVAPFVDVVYRASAPDGSAVLLATLLFALHIYCDFSGYSEIASGSARLMGIRLMRNFDRPYGADSVRAFWRRWHISLTVWFTDYVYIPLGGSKRGLRRQLFATTVVFALCGLWHGAAWNFIVWGLLHACFLNLHTLACRVLPKPPSGVPGRVLTLAAVCFAWLFFRADGLTHAMALLQQLFSPWDVAAGLQLMMRASLRSTPAPALLSLLGAVLLLLHRLPCAAREDTTVPCAVWAGLLLSILLALLIRLDGGVVNAFIYFQF